MRFGIVAPVGLLVSLVGQSASASPGPLFFTDDLRVAARDDRGSPVIPHRFDCQEVSFSSHVGQLPHMSNCVGWEVFLHPETAPWTPTQEQPEYVPFAFRADGSGIVRLPGGVFPRLSRIHFLTAHHAGLAPAVVLLEKQQAVPRELRDRYLLVFAKSRGQAPVMKTAPSCTILPRHEERGVRLQLSVLVEVPEGERLYFDWIFAQGTFHKEDNMEMEVSALLGPQQFTAIACDPHANCTAAYLPVDVRPLPGFEPKDPLFAAQLPASSLKTKGKKPTRTGQVLHANYPTKIQHCNPGRAEKPVRKPGT